MQNNTNKKVALITGITGQDGSYLAEFLLEKGYSVHGVIRRSSVDFRERIAHLEGKPHFHLHYADMGDSMSILGVIGKKDAEKDNLCDVSDDSVGLCWRFIPQFLSKKVERKSCEYEKLQRRHGSIHEL